MHQQRRLSKRERRLIRQTGETDDTQNAQPRGLQLRDVQPLTENQAITFDAYERGDNLMLHGIAGVGKSFLALYLALEEIMSGSTTYEKVIIVRSVVPTRDMGFMPGNSKEKAKVYEAPYYAICTELFGRKDAYETLKSKGILEFETTSFIRGRTLNDCIVIVDEIANMTGHELDSVMTRVGKNCRILFCGDFRQSDFTRDQEKNGLHDFMDVVKRLRSWTFVDFQAEDIVRSEAVKAYIIMKTNLRKNF